MNIRPMTLEDLEAVSEIETLCFSVPWSKEALRETLNTPNAYYVVAEEGGQVIGYGGMLIILDEGEITNIAVTPKWRGKGKGQDILEDLLAVAIKKELVHVLLEVRAGNEAAKGLYLKKGFRVIGERKAYYKKPTENALIMQKMISSYL